MKKIKIEIFILIIGILLCIIGHLGVKKYFENNYLKETKYVLAYNNYSNITFDKNVIEPIVAENVMDTEEKISPTTTTTTIKPITTKKITTTTLITTTTMKPTEVFDNVINKPIIEDTSEIIYDGLTKKQLIEKLNKNLTSTLTNTGHYFVNYYLETGLDPYLAVAIVLQETGCKWTCSKIVRNCNNIGGIKGSPSCNGGSYKMYETLEDGIIGYLNMLHKNYYSKGLTTPEAINPKFATSTTWSVNVNKYIDNIKAS